MNNKRLKELYELLPEIDCQGHCWRSCGVAPTGDAEQKNISDAYGEKSIPTPGGDMICNQLDRDTHKCTIHDERPLICRLFGLIKNDLMRCPHGCEPEYWLTEEVADKLINKIIKGEDITIDDESIRRTNNPFRQAIESEKD